MAKPAIEIRNLRKRYGRHLALDGLDIKVPRGSTFGIVGPNGAGKTTTFSIIAGLLRPDDGEINILNNGRYNPDIHKGLMAILPQDSVIPGHSRVRECLVYFARLQGLTKYESYRSADEVLEWVDLRDRADRSVKTLSHGMIRRLTVAQAFLGSPEIVLLDEPVSGLDPKQVVNIRALIRGRRAGQTVVVSSHILPEIEAACDYVAFVDKGRTTRQDSLESIVQRARIVQYRVGPGKIPENEIQSAIPGAEITISSDRCLLTLRAPDDSMEPSAINSLVLPLLLKAEIGIIEVQSGSDLESEYLKQQ